MGENASGFRERARQCRDLAANARDEESRRTLNRMADELEEEAGKLDAGESATPKIVLEPKLPDAP